MAKKATPEPVTVGGPDDPNAKTARQTVFAGVEDVIPEVVTFAAEKYVKSKRNVADIRTKMNAALDDLIEKMKEAKISSLLIDDRAKRLRLCTKDLVKIQKRKKNKDGTIEDVDDDE